MREMLGFGWMGEKIFVEIDGGDGIWEMGGLSKGDAVLGGSLPPRTAGCWLRLILSLALNFPCVSFQPFLFLFF